MRHYGCLLTNILCILRLHMNYYICKAQIPALWARHPQSTSVSYALKQSWNCFLRLLIQFVDTRSCITLETKPYWNTFSWRLSANKQTKTNKLFVIKAFKLFKYGNIYVQYLNDSSVNSSGKLVIYYTELDQKILTIWLCL